MRSQAAPLTLGLAPSKTSRTARCLLTDTACHCQILFLRNSELDSDIPSLLLISMFSEYRDILSQTCQASCQEDICLESGPSGWPGPGGLPSHLCKIPNIPLHPTKQSHFTAETGAKAATQANHSSHSHFRSFERFLDLGNIFFLLRAFLG